ncbi:MAG TPA: hypothetical protein PKE32_07580, partial [Miltoncostaeaceae bacterium]|nr:hypothetical protein [Miltoncostaeaceae bacterium]
EADRLPVPGAALLAQLSEPLRAARPSLERALAHETLPEAVAVVDRVLLIDGLGIDPAVIDRLAQARAALAARRAARARRA